MVVNIGGGITEAAVVTMNNIVRAESGRVGGLRQDEAIMAYVRRKYNLSIGQPTAEAIKIQIGAAVDLPDPMAMEIQGRDNVSGLPRTISISTGEVVEALAEPLSMIAGGGALLRGMDQFLTRETGVPVYRAENPLIAVAVGAGRALEDPAVLRRISNTP
jgi:rod shape-determining protein MreB